MSGRATIRRLAHTSAQALIHRVPISVDAIREAAAVRQFTGPRAAKNESQPTESPAPNVVPSRPPASPKTPRTECPCTKCRRAQRRRCLARRAVLYFASTLATTSLAAALSALALRSPDYCGALAGVTAGAAGLALLARRDGD